MEISNYEQLMDEILSMPLMEERIPEGAMASPLYITRHTGTKCHGLLGLSPQDEQTCLVCGSFAVVDPGMDPVYRAVPEAAVDIGMADEDACMRYLELYPAVYGFAFESRLTAGQKQTLRQFLEAWDQGLSESVRKAADAAFPDFRIWADQILRER